MPLRKKQKRYVYAAITLAVVAAIAIYSYFVDTRGAALAPKCPIFFAKGYKCPGCGTLNEAGVVYCKKCGVNIKKAREGTDKVKE